MQVQAHQVGQAHEDLLGLLLDGEAPGMGEEPTIVGGCLLGPQVHDGVGLSDATLPGRQGANGCLRAMSLGVVEADASSLRVVVQVEPNACPDISMGTSC